MTAEITGALIGAGCTLIGILIANWSNFLMQKANAKLQTDITERQIKNSFQLAAMEKRLEAHQEAYNIWLKMSSYVYAPHDQRLKLKTEAFEFFGTHCLYLEPKAAEAFRICTNYYYDYQTQLDFIKLLDRQAPETKQSMDNLLTWWDHIHDTGRIIMEGAKYPFIEIEPTKEDPMGEKKEDTKEKLKVN